MGDLVWKVILKIDKKKNQKHVGNSPLIWEGPFKIEKVFSGNAYALIDVNSSLKIALINGNYLKHYKPTMHEVKIRQQ